MRAGLRCQLNIAFFRVLGAGDLKVPNQEGKTVYVNHYLFRTRLPAM
jgi:hypothetical protein